VKAVVRTRVAAALVAESKARARACNAAAIPMQRHTVARRLLPLRPPPSRSESGELRSQQLPDVDEIRTIVFPESDHKGADGGRPHRRFGVRTRACRSIASVCPRGAEVLRPCRRTKAGRRRCAGLSRAARMREHAGPAQPVSDRPRPAPEVKRTRPAPCPHLGHEDDACDAATKHGWSATDFARTPPLVLRAPDAPCPALRSGCVAT
jgi:hypothetical protein